MIDTNLLKEKYNLSKNEYKAICQRVHELDDLEQFNHTVISRCNCTLKPTMKWLKKRLNKEEAEHCKKFFEDNGGFCNCEILFNVLPFVYSMEKEIGNEKGPGND